METMLKKELCNILTECFARNLQPPHEAFIFSLMQLLDFENHYPGDESQANIIKMAKILKFNSRTDPRVAHSDNPTPSLLTYQEDLDSSSTPLEYKDLSLIKHSNLLVPLLF